MTDEILINLEEDLTVNMRPDSDEVLVTFSDDIVVRVRQGNEVAVELTSQGIQGPRGKDGVLTPSLEEARDDALAAAEQAEAALGSLAGEVADAEAARNAAQAAQGSAEAAATSANTSKNDAVAARDLATQAKTDAQAARADAIQAKTDAQAAKILAEAARDAAHNSELAADAAADDAIEAAADADADRTAAQTARTGAENAKTAAETARSGAEAARTGAENAETGAEAAQTSAEAARDIAVAAANVAGGFRYRWSTDTTASDPGAGKLKVNAAGTTLYISETDKNGAAMAAVIATWDDSSNTALRSTLTISKVGDPATFKVLSITSALTDSGVYDSFTVATVVTNGVFADGDDVTVNVARTGNLGSTGAQGPVPAVQLKFSTTTTDADPGAGVFRLNVPAASIATAAWLYIDNTDNGAADIQAWLDSLDDSTSSVKGYLYLRGSTTTTHWASFKVTGPVIDGTGYRKVPVAYISGSGTFANNAIFYAAFTPTGDLGEVVGNVTSVNGKVGAVILNSDDIDDTGHAHQFVVAADKVKLGYITVTAATNLDTIRTAVAGLGTAATKNTGTASGNVPILDANGKLPEAVLPSVAISDTFEVATQAAMLALTAERGDIAVRSDINKSFILKQTPATTLANWVELKTPTDAVLSVAGRTGAVTLTKADVGLSNVSDLAPADLPVSTAQQTAIDAMKMNTQIFGATDAGVSDSDHMGWRRLSDGVLIKRTLNQVALAISARLGLQMQTGVTAKATVVDADQALISDSAAANASKRITFSTIWTYIKGKADAIYAAASSVYSKTEMDAILEDFQPATDLDRQYAKWESGATVYTLPIAPAGYTYLDVYVGGVLQPKDGSAYSFVGDQLTLSESPGAEMVEVYVFGSMPPLNGEPDLWLEEIVQAPAQAFTDATMIPGVKSDGTLLTRTWANLKADFGAIFVAKAGDTLTGELKSTSANNYRLKAGTSYGAFQRVDANNWYFMTTALDDADGSWRSPFPITIRFSDQLVSIGTSLNINGTIGGNAVATAAQYRANTANKILTTDQVWSAAAQVNLGNLSGSVSLNFGNFLSAYATIVGNISFDGTSGLVQGQTGTITLIQSGGPWTLSVSATYFETPDGKGISLGDGRNKLTYEVQENGKVFLALAGKALA